MSDSPKICKLAWQMFGISFSFFIFQPTLTPSPHVIQWLCSFQKWGSPRSHQFVIRMIVIRHFLDKLPSGFYMMSFSIGLTSDHTQCVRAIDLCMCKEYFSCSIKAVEQRLIDAIDFIEIINSRWSVMKTNNAELPGDDQFKFG